MERSPFFARPTSGELAHDSRTLAAVRLDSEGMYEEALQGYDRILFGQDPPAVVWGLKAQLLLKLGRHAQALECIEIALARGCYGDEEICVARGICLLAVGRPEEAKGSFERAMEIRMRPATLALLAECFHRMGRNLEATQTRLRALEQDPEGESLAQADEILQGL